MENNLYLHLLIKILDLNSSDIKKIIDSKISIHELIFSDKEYLRKCLKLKESTISKLEALKTLISEISFEELRKREKIESSKDAVKYLKTILRTLRREYLVVLFLNKANAVVDQIKIRGSIDEVQMDYRSIIKRAVLSDATNIICAHNHPSGNVDRSTQDRTITFELKKRMEAFDIRLLDHIIISRDSYYSFAEHNLLQDEPKRRGKNKH